MKKVTLYNVMDIRTGKVHSVVIVKARDAHWFVPIEQEEE